MWEVLAWILLFSPLSGVVIKNWNKYFLTNKAGFSVATGGVLAILLVVLLLKYGAKKFGKLFWATALLVCVWSLNSIIQDALVLTLAFWIGACCYSICEFPRNYYKKRLDAWNEEVVKTYAREETKQKITTDVNVLGR